MRRPEDPEDKQAWCRWGEQQELLFLAEQYRFFDGREPYSLNPEKADDPCVIDFVRDGTYADLKRQTTPFFTADRYGVDPQFAVTFNEKDLEHYASVRPYPEVIFWVTWTETQGYGRHVMPMEGVWVWPYPALDMAAAQSDRHCYARRTSDSQGNGRASFVIDVREGANYSWLEP